MRNKNDIRNFVNIPDYISLGNLLFGCFSIFSALHGAHLVAALCIVVSAIFDLFDGRVARKLNLASEFGLEVTIPQLQGIFMYLHSDNKKPSFRQHFSAKLIGGKLKIPDGVIDVKWFSPKKAIIKMLNPDAKIVTAIGEMTKHILIYPEIIWGGSYLIIKKVGKKTESKVLENFYPIGRVERNILKN